MTRWAFLISAIAIAACGSTITLEGAPTETEGGNDSACPQMRPVHGSECKPGLECEYPPDEECANATLAVCDVALGWRIMVGSADAECPADLPAAGEACIPRCGQAIAGDYECRYPALAPCDADTVIRASCFDTWEIFAPSCVVCPAAEPTEGSACAYHGELCGYDDVGCRRWRCDAGEWKRYSWDPEACNGTVTYCPDAIPTDGAACMQDEGFSCYYTCGNGESVAAFCNSVAVWSVQPCNSM